MICSGQSIGVVMRANKMMHTKACFLPISTESFDLQVAQMPKSRDLVIFIATTD